MTPLLVKMIVVVESNNQTKIMFQHSILNRILLYQKYIRCACVHACVCVCVCVCVCESKQVFCVSNFLF